MSTSAVAGGQRNTTASDASVAVVTIAQSRSAPLTLAAHVLAGSVWTLGLANFNIAVQMSSPRWVMGRMLATYQTVAFAGMAVGSWTWGEFASVAGLRESLTAAGVAMLGGLAVARWFPVSVARPGSLDPHTFGAVAPPPVELDPASGPIVTTIEYRVPLANAAEFVSAVNELGRIRRRDGARRWSVVQDLDDPEAWIERFESPSWTSRCEMCSCPPTNGLFPRRTRQMVTYTPS